MWLAEQLQFECDSMAAQQEQEQLELEALMRAQWGPLAFSAVACR